MPCLSACDSFKTAEWFLIKFHIRSFQYLLKPENYMKPKDLYFAGP
jgi:hypothetical protein